MVLDWTINAHGTPANICGGVSTNCYPGDDVVDIVGIDNYDMAPSATSAADFASIAAAPDGLTWTYDFARRHGKPFSVDEWGVAPGSEWNTTGENPEFIRWMHDWFAAHASGLAYEAYFNSCASGVGSNIYRPAGAGCARQRLPGRRRRPQPVRRLRRCQTVVRCGRAAAGPGALGRMSGSGSGSRPIPGGSALRRQSRG